MAVKQMTKQGQWVCFGPDLHRLFIWLPVNLSCNAPILRSNCRTNCFNDPSACFCTQELLHRVYHVCDNPSACTSKIFSCVAHDKRRRGSTCCASFTSDRPSTEHHAAKVRLVVRPCSPTGFRPTHRPHEEDDLTQKSSTHGTTQHKLPPLVFCFVYAQRRMQRGSTYGASITSAGRSNKVTLAAQCPKRQSSSSTEETVL